MSHDNRDTDYEALPKATIEHSSRWSVLWLLPLVAIALGAWLTYQAWREKGPEILIRFDKGEGLEAKQTLIKYKDVNVGRVETLALSDDLKSVLVTARLNRELGAHLSENTRFWVVKPSITSKGISGLDTLVSGVYIAVDPGPEGEDQRTFEGLSKAPIVASDRPGKRFSLQADSLGSLETGSPVMYRQISVGEVVHYGLDEAEDRVNIDIFINAPYDTLVQKNSRFWNTSGLDFNLSASGIDAHFESLSTLIAGGIAFDAPTSLSGQQPAPGGHEFPLYANRQALKQRSYANKLYYVLYFEDSIRGLTLGSPVEMRGITIGKVVDIRMDLDPDSITLSTPVLVEIEPERFITDSKQQSFGHVIQLLVDKGLRAQLNLGNILTGQLYVDMVEMTDTDTALPMQTSTEGFLIFPTASNDFETITRNVSDILNKLNQLPLVEIGEDLQETVSSVRSLVSGDVFKKALKDLGDTLSEAMKLMSGLRKDMGPLLRHADDAVQQAEDTLVSVQKTFDTSNKLVSAKSPTLLRMNDLIEDTQKAARSFKDLTDYLRRNPNSLLYGKSDSRR